MDWVEKINQSLSYIEKNLFDDIQYKEIERIILSPIDALQRFFMLNTGMTLTEYIRRRKLSKAVEALRNSDEKIIDIAIKLGYGSSDAFSLAFKRLFGITPSEARSSNVALKPFPRMVFSLSITYIEGEIVVKNISAIKPFVEEQEIFIMPEIRIIGLEVRLKYRGEPEGENPIPALWRKFFAEGFATGLDKLPKVIPNAWLGWTGDCPEGKSDWCSYIVSGAYPSGTPVPKGYVYRDLYASYVAKGEFGDNVHEVVNKFKPNGFITNYHPVSGWNAELYFLEEQKNPPKKDCYPSWRWLVPCVKVDEM